MLLKRGSVPVGLSLSALACTPSPGVLSTAPRARGSAAPLKKSPERKLGAADSSGTLSQLISRRPLVCEPGTPPLFGSPSKARYSSTRAVMSPAPETTFELGRGAVVGKIATGVAATDEN